MLGLSLVSGLLIFRVVYIANGSTQQSSEPLIGEQITAILKSDPPDIPPRLAAIQAPLILSTPTPEPTSPPKKPVKRASYVPVAANCVATLKASGDLPNKPVTKDGLARTIPTKPVDLKPGMERVIKTTEGAGTGHVVKVRINEAGQAVSIVEGGYPGGVGRVVDPSVIIGEVDKTKL